MVAMPALLPIACCKKDPEPDRIEISATNLRLPADGGEQTFSVTTNLADWSISSGADWLTVEKRGGGTAAIRAEANAGQERGTTVVCTAGSATATLSVSQGQLAPRQSDSLALLPLFGAASDKPMEQWSGVTVTDGRVTRLNLSNASLTGTIPESLGSLSGLKSLDMSNNSLSGTIPESLGSLSELEFLDLSNNSLSGSAPRMDALTGLITLDLSRNALTALPALPASAGLEYLAFRENQLNGILPNLSAFADLRYLDASHNGFSGNIPASWSSLTKMKILYLHENSLDGNIPSFLAAFAGAEELALDNNNLAGNIPEGLGNLKNLKKLYLSQNLLTGSVPASLLNNPLWSEWKNEVCPQKSGGGFENCTTTRTGGTKDVRDMSRFKKSIR